MRKPVTEASLYRLSRAGGNRADSIASRDANRSERLPWLFGYGWGIHPEKAANKPGSQSTSARLIASANGKPPCRIPRSAESRRWNGRSPGSRIVALLRLPDTFEPVHALCISGISEYDYSLTVAGTAKESRLNAAPCSLISPYRAPFLGSILQTPGSIGNSAYPGYCRVPTPCPPGYKRR